jgi:hypothetical protein
MRGTGRLDPLAPSGEELAAIVVALDALLDQAAGPVALPAASCWRPSRWRLAARRDDLSLDELRLRSGAARWDR